MTSIPMTQSMIDFRLSKLGKVNPATKLKAIEIIKAAAKAGHDIWFVWGVGGGEHSAPPGLALDLMVRNEAAGDWVRNYIWANRARLRLRHVIWEQHITSTVTSPGVRRKMADRGTKTKNHYDHNHVRFLEGAYVAPTGTKTPAPVPTEGSTDDPTLERGDTGRRVAALQAHLKQTFPKYAGSLVVDGSFGPATQRVVMEFQARSGLEVDGKVGPATRAALQPPAPPKTQTPAPPKPKLKSLTVIAQEVWAGKWGTGADRLERLKKAGYDAEKIQDMVNRGVGKAGVVRDPNRRSISQIASEVIAGKWGNGDDRKRRLTRAGYDAVAVQHEVNRRV